MTAAARIPVNSLSRHIAPLAESLSLAAAEVISGGRFVLGNAVESFEQAFADYCGTTSCVGVANGSDALELALRALGVEPGSQVAVCANAAMYGTLAVLACGAEPMFVDVDPNTQLITPATLADALTRAPDCSAVIVTHLYGRLAEVDPLVAMCHERGIRVLEDCAQAHGARHADGRRAGSFGDAGSFSFYPTKNLGALGDGGAVVTSNPDIARRVRQLRQYGWERKYENRLRGGRNSRLDELQARFLLAQLPHLDGWNLRRRQIAARLSVGIRHPDIVVPEVGGEEYVAHLYVVASRRREALRAHLSGHGVDSEVHYPIPDHHQPCHAGRYDGLSLPNTERLAQEVLTLPCFPEMTDDEIERVIHACNTF